MGDQNQVENVRNISLHNSAGIKENNMVIKQVEHLKSLFLHRSEKKQSDCTKQPRFSTDSSFIMWENDSNICWLDASMALLVHNQTMRRVIKLNPDCLVSKITKCYDDAIGTLNDFSSDETTEERLNSSREMLQKVQEVSLKYLQPLIKYKKGEPDSAFCSLLNLIKEDKLIQGFFDITYAWCRLCDNCEMQRVLTATKPIITIANVNKFVPENHISPCLCPVCKKKDQTMKLVYKKLPACLIFHFENGAGIGDSPPLNFHVAFREYQLTGLMILEKSQESNVDHFVTYIRDPSLKKWLECNDLNMDIVSFDADPPNFDLKDVFIYVYEAFDDLGTIQIEEDASLSSSNHNIPCIDISEGENENEDVNINSKKIPENDRFESTEPVESIENITAFLSASFEVDSSTQPTSIAETDKHYQKNIGSSKITTESSSLLTKSVSILTEPNIASLKVNADNSDQTTISEFENDLKNEKILGISSENSLFNKSNDLNEKQKASLYKEDKISQIPKPVVTPVTHERGRSLDIDKYINNKLNEFNLQYDKENSLNKNSVAGVSSNYSNTYDTSIEHSISSLRKKKELAKVDVMEKVMEQSFELNKNSVAGVSSNYSNTYDTSIEHSISSLRKKKELAKVDVMEKVMEQSFELNKNSVAGVSSNYSNTYDTSIEHSISSLRKKKELAKVGVMEKVMEQSFELNKNSVAGVSSNYSNTYDTSIEHSISPLRKKKKLAKIDVMEKMMEQSFEISNAEDSYTKNKVCKSIDAVEAPDSVSNTTTLMMKIRQNHLQKKDKFAITKILDKEIESKHKAVSTEEMLSQKKKCTSSDKLLNKNLKLSSTGVETKQLHNSKNVEFSKANESPDASVHEDTTIHSSNKKQILKNEDSKLSKQENLIAKNETEKSNLNSLNNSLAIGKLVSTNEISAHNKISHKFDKESHCVPSNPSTDPESTRMKTSIKESFSRTIDNESSDDKLLLKIQQTTFKKIKLPMNNSLAHALSVSTSISNNKSADLNKASCSYSPRTYLNKISKPKHEITKDLNKHISTDCNKNGIVMEDENIIQKDFMKSQNKLDNVLAHSLADIASSESNENASDIDMPSSNNSETDEPDNIPKFKQKKSILQVRFAPQINKLDRSKQLVDYESDDSDEENMLIFKGKRKNISHEDNSSSESISSSKRLKSGSLMNRSFSSPENFDSETFSNPDESVDIPSHETNCQCEDTDMEALLDATVDHFVANMLNLFKIK